MTPKRILQEIVARWELGVARYKADLNTQEIPRTFVEASVVIDYARQMLSGEPLISPIPDGRTTRTPWATVDWNKPNKEIAALLGRTASSVCMHRPDGFPRTKLARKVDWDKVDWTKRNGVLAGELDISITSVNCWRNKLGKPQAYHVGDTKPHRKVSQEQIDSADWIGLRDVDIQVLFRCSRERVRQIRIEHHKPVCRFEGKGLPLIRTIVAVEKLKESITGKDIKDIEPILRPVLGVVRIYPLRKALIFAGVPFTEKRVRPHLKYPIDDIDWRLSNVILTIIYGACTNVIASMRSLNAKPAPTWVIVGGFSRFFESPAFNGALESEIAKAKDRGFDNGDAARKYVSEYRARVYQRWGTPDQTA